MIKVKCPVCENEQEALEGDALDCDYFHERVAFTVKKFGAIELMPIKTVSAKEFLDNLRGFKMTDQERERFEKWQSEISGFSNKRSAGGDLYFYPEVNYMFAAWKARAEIAAEENGALREENELLKQQLEEFQVDNLTMEDIKQIALKYGFKLKPQENGEEDLNGYVYEFAACLLHIGSSQHNRQLKEQIKQLEQRLTNISEIIDARSELFTSDEELVLSIKDRLVK